MNPSQTKANRLLQIEALLLAHPEGLTQADIARRLGVNRSTINRYIPELPGHIYIDDLDGGKWKVDRQANLINVRFNLHEALAVHLASCLLATALDRQNPHAAAALRKLSVALERLAPLISAHMNQSADLIDENSQRQDANYLRSLEVLTAAWAEGRKVLVWHRKDHNEPARQYTFCPYDIEPSSVGRSTYAIGLREPPGAIRTFKIERIERVELLKDTYEIPAEFQPSQLLADAWGIWFTETEPVEVVLKFNQRVAQRLGETRWHRSEQVTKQADGSLLWRACIAEPQEMMPWIRGWGADVEVLSPVELREQLMAQVNLLAHVYGGNRGLSAD